MINLKNILQSFFDRFLRLILVIIFLKSLQSLFKSFPRKLFLLQSLLLLYQHLFMLLVNLVLLLFFYLPIIRIIQKTQIYFRVLFNFRWLLILVWVFRLWSVVFPQIWRISPMVILSFSFGFINIFGHFVRDLINDFRISGVDGTDF